MNNNIEKYSYKKSHSQDSYKKSLREALSRS